MEGARKMSLYTLANVAEEHVAASRKWIENYDRTAHIGATANVRPTRDYHRAVCALPEPVTIETLNTVAAEHGRRPITSAGRCDLCYRHKRALVVIEGHDEVLICRGCAKRMVALLKPVRARVATRKSGEAERSILSRIVRASDL